MSLAPPIPPPLTRIAAVESRFAAAPLSAVRSAALGSTVTSPASGFGGETFGTLLDALTGNEANGSLDSDSVARSVTATLGRQSSMGGTATPGSGATGTDLIAAASEYLGVPYRWGGTNPESGLDCSGLVQRACADIGISVPRVSRDQARVGTEIPSLDQARPGDLIAFGRPTVDHIAIYVGDGKILHAPRTGDVVRITPIRRDDIASIRRVTDGSVAPGSVGAGSVAGVRELSGYPPAGSSGTGLSISSSSGVGLRESVPYRAEFTAAAQKYGLDPALLAAVAKVESGFNPNAVSRAGATGLMQFMPATAAGMGINPSDPSQAIDGAGRYLSTQLARFGSLDLALAAYNAGPRAVERAGGIPPYPETQNYVRKVRGAMNQVRS